MPCSDNAHQSFIKNEFTTDKGKCDNFLSQHLDETSLHLATLAIQTIQFYTYVLT